MTTQVQDLAARARWHLEIGYPPELECCDDDEVEWDGERYTCWCCGGEGFEITCCDDLCHGQGYCMHGGGHRSCSECGGEGVL